jgi:cytochrome P450
MTSREIPFDARQTSPLSDPDVQRCPYRYYEQLRSHSPVSYDAALEVFIVSRYDLLREVCQNSRIYSSAGSLDFPRVSPAAAEVAQILKDAYRTTPLTVSIDPPDHTRYRLVMNRVLSPQRMRDAAPMIDRLVARFLGDMLIKGGGEFVEEFAVRLPFAVICNLMGLPESMWDRVRRWADSYTAPLFGHISYEREIECARLYVERQDYLSDLVNRYRSDTHPPDNLIAGVATSRLEDGEYMSMADALSMIDQFVVAGAETTKNSLALGALLLARRPDLRLTSAEDASKVECFVEESLRLYAPAQAMMRVVSEDTELHGVRVPKGSRVMLRFGAGNTDEAAFPAAEQIDLNRKNIRSHLTFGHGIHMCQGAPLARTELASSFRALCRLSELNLANGDTALEYMKAHSFMGLVRLDLSMRGPPA